MTTMPTDQEITRAQRLARLAAKQNRSLAECPYDANGTPKERVLAARYVAAYVKAGGTVDGLTLDAGDDAGDKTGAGRPAQLEDGGRIDPAAAVAAVALVVLVGVVVRSYIRTPTKGGPTSG